MFAALKPYNLNWSCQASINVGQDNETLTLMKESGCGAILVGLESISEKSVLHGEGINLRHNYADAIKNIQAHGMLGAQFIHTGI